MLQEKVQRKLCFCYEKHFFYYLQSMENFLIGNYIIHWKIKVILQ